MPKRYAFEPDQQYGQLVTISCAVEKGSSVWTCRCLACGKVCKAHASNIVSGKTKSCGCLMNAVRHGHKRNGHRSLTARSYDNMVRRCENPNFKQYADYGGRGIRIFEGWRGPGGFERFLADAGERPGPEYSLDRIDNDGHYEPGNVRWVTRKTQQRNSRKNRLLTFRGETRPMSEWAEIVGLPYKVVCERMRRGWSVEKTLTQPIDFARSHRRK